MKVNLIINPSEHRNGYINISPLAQQDDPNCINSDPTSLSIYLDNGEATEIIALDLIDFIPISDKQKVLAHWISKLGVHGTITVGGNEIKQVTRSYAYNQIDLQGVLNLLYGDNIPRHGILSCEHMCKLLNSFGLHIVEKRIQDYTFYIKAERIS